MVYCHYHSLFASQCTPNQCLQRKQKRKQAKTWFKWVLNSWGDAPTCGDVLPILPMALREGRDAQGRTSAKAGVTLRRLRGTCCAWMRFGVQILFFLLLFFPEVPGRSPWVVAHPRLGEVPQVKAKSATLPPCWAVGTHRTAFKAFLGCFDGFLMISFGSVWFRQAQCFIYFCL